MVGRWLPVTSLSNFGCRPDGLLESIRSMQTFDSRSPNDPIAVRVIKCEHWTAAICLVAFAKGDSFTPSQGD